MGRLGVNNRIKALRIARGLSLEELAALAGTTNQQISLLESGKRRFTTDWLIKLGSALGCHPWELVSDDLPQPAQPEEIRLLEGFRDLPTVQREALLVLVDSLVAKPTKGRKGRRQPA